MKRKIAAIFAADIAGYSRLVAEDEEDTLRRLKAYRKVTDEFIAEAGGRIFNTAGDAVLAEFPSAVDAVRCAIDIQESLRTRNSAFPPSRQMSFRIGITIGDVVESDDGDLLGDGVNIAARLEGLAEVGGICVSRAVYEQVANKLSVHFADMGAKQVKNIPTPVHVYRIGKPSEDSPPTTSGSSIWGFLRDSKSSTQPAGDGASQGWTARLAAACDRSTLLEALVAFVALAALAQVPVAAVHAPAGMLTYGTIGLLSGIVVLVAVWLLDRRLQLSWADRAAAAAAYGAVCWLGSASIPILGYVGLNGYEAGYIGTTELSVFLGCVGACAASWRKRRGHTVFVALLLIAILLAYRYALFHSSLGTLSALVVPLPAVLIGCLIATAQWRVSAALDVAAIIAVWLLASATVLIAAVPAAASLLQYSNPIFLVGMAVPTALAWPAIRLARPNLAWPAASGPLIFDRFLKAGAAILAVVYVIGLATTSAERNSPLSRCVSEDGVEACGTVIDSLQASVEDRITALNIRVSRYTRDSKWDQAIADLSKLIELDPKNPERYTARADLWGQIESYDQAIGDIDAAIALQPNNPRLYLARSGLWKEKGDDGRALADLDQVVRLEPSAENLTKRAEYHWKQVKNYQKALADYSLAIRLDPSNKYSFDYRSHLVGEMTNYSAQATMKYLDEFVSREPSLADNYRIRAEARDDSEIDKKLSDYGQAIRLKPDDADLRLVRAALLEKKRDLAAAIADYDRAVQLDPRNAKALYQRGMAKSSKGDRTGSADIAAAKAIDPDVDK